MLLGPIDCQPLADWIAKIPFEDWPQQRRLDDDKIRPAMVTDLNWHSFGERSDLVVAGILDRFFPGKAAYQRMISVVMPGHSIPPHVDGQDKRWICRVHVPLLSNDKSRFIVEGVAYELLPGFAYRVDTTKEHAVTNHGDTPRIHFMFDVGNA